MKLWCLTEVLVVLISAVFSNQGELRYSVFVNSQIGSIEPNCSSMTRPCKDLQEALDKSTAEVIIVGTIQLNSTIFVRRNLTIRSDEEHKTATLKWVGDITQQNTAFTIQENLSLNVSGITFINLGVVSVNNSSNVSIKNCRVTGVIEHVFRFGDSVPVNVSLDVQNTTFDNITGSVIAGPNNGDLLALIFVGCKFHNIGCGVVHSESAVQDVAFHQCTITDIGIRRKCVAVLLWSSKSILFSKCLFHQSIEGKSRGAISLNNVASVHIVSSMFQNLHCAYFVLQEQGTKNFSLSHTTFRANRVDQSSIAFFQAAASISIDNCVFSNNKAGNADALYMTYVIQILYYIGTELPIATITNTTFNNDLADEHFHAIYSIAHLKLRKVTVKGVSGHGSLHLIVSQMGNFTAQYLLMDIQSNGDNVVHNGLFVRSRNIARKSSFRFSCPLDFNLDFNVNHMTDGKDLSSLNFRCVSCVKGTYSLHRGMLAIPDLDYSGNNYTAKGKIQCMKCPSGGICAKGAIKASPHFWGFNESDRVTFRPCPINYCCSPKSTQCESFDTCVKGRTGILCGKCALGYRLNFHNDSCVGMDGECDDGLFLWYVIIHSMSLTLFFAYITNITRLVKKVWNHSKGIFLCCNNNRNEDATHMKIEDLPKRAIFTLFVFYYQLASLLHVDVGKQKAQNEVLEDLKNAIKNFVYFRFTIYLHKNVCPTGELTFVHKAGINLGIRMSTLVNLILLFVLSRIMILLQKKGAVIIHSRLFVWVGRTFWEPSTSKFRFFYPSLSIIYSRQLDEEKHDDKRAQVMSLQQYQEQQPVRQEYLNDCLSTNNIVEIKLRQKGGLEESQNFKEISHQTMSFTVRLQLTFIKLLKAIYTPITYMSFQLIYCITIKGKNHLYVSGDVECYSWWQMIILILILPALFTFPLSFGMAMYLIKARQITARQFLVAAGIPYYSIYLYAKYHYSGPTYGCYSRKDAFFIDKMLKTQNDVYRQGDHVRSWVVIQLYRNLVVAAVKTFIINPMYRSLTFLPIFVLFLLHDRSAKPFRSKVVNVMQTSSSACLCVIVICNVMFSFALYMPSIETILYMSDVLNVLCYIEAVVYVIFPLMLPVIILRRKYATKVNSG